MAVILSEEARRENARRFVNATRELIDAEGLEKISVRKIAARAGFHNSTIYLYFKDVNQLILLASLKHFRNYSKELSLLSRKESSAAETFYSVWTFFCQTVFDQPQIFYNFFFGKYSDNLTDIMKEYYQLFPEEKGEYSQEIQEMYYAPNISQRCLLFLKPLTLDPDSRITEENIDLVNEMIVSFMKVLLEEKCSNPQQKSTDYVQKMLDMLHYSVEK